MHTVEPDIDRPDSDLVAAFEDVPSAIVSDVSGNVGVALHSDIEPVSGGVHMAGTALTVNAAPGDNLIIHKAITLAEPGDVLVVDGDAFTEAAFMGELMCASCQAQGLAGVVIDGAIRDRAEIAEMDIPAYARSVHPQGPLKQDPGSINTTISCAGVTIAPGDILVGDDDGVSVVRPDEAEGILEASREKIAAEAELRERVDAGEYLHEIGGYDEVLDGLDVIGPEDSA